MQRELYATDSDCQANGLRYLRWGSDGETVRADNVTALIMFESGTLPQRQVHALLASHQDMQAAWVISTFNGATITFADYGCPTI